MIFFKFAPNKEKKVMKKAFILTVVFFITLVAKCGNVFVFEQFDNSYLPSGWSVTGSEAGYYNLSETNKAGGTPYEMEFYCHIMGTWRLITNKVDLTGVESVDVAFKQFYDISMGAGITVGIATSSDGGQHWHSGWSQTYSSGGQHQVNATIATEDMGQPNVRFCIYYTNANDMNYSYIYVDDISVFVQNDLDIELQEINVDEVQAHRSFDVGMRLFNTGDNNVTSVECTYQFNDNQVVTQTFNENIPSGTFKNLVFDVPADMIPDDYTLTVSVTKVNGGIDDDISNNTLYKKVSVACVPAQRKPLFEHFSASSCGTCPVLSTAMDNFCSQNPDKFTYVKYMMNWPPPGDPYYTAEGNVRKMYYGVNQLPWLFMDSYDCGVNAPTQTLFDEHYNEPATMEIGGSFYTEGTMIHVTAEIMPFASLDDVNVFVSVNEKVTHNNATVNGETAFHHVMMKMMPSAQGTTVSLHAGQLERLTFDYNLSGTHVEEMNDLEVAVWIQRFDTKRVYNSTFIYETENHPYQPDNLTATKSGNTLHATWDAPSQGNPVGYNIWLNEDMVAQNVNITSYDFNNINADAYYCVQVQAIYTNDIVSVKAVATTNEYWEIQELNAETVAVYPNPANDVVNVIADNAKITLMTIQGRFVGISVENNNKIDISSLPSGVYLLKIESSEGIFFEKIIKQ